MQSFVNFSLLKQEIYSAPVCDSYKPWPSSMPEMPKLLNLIQGIFLSEDKTSRHAVAVRNFINKIQNTGDMNGKDLTNLVSILSGNNVNTPYAGFPQIKSKLIGSVQQIIENSINSVQSVSMLSNYNSHNINNSTLEKIIQHNDEHKRQSAVDLQESVAKTHKATEEEDKYFSQVSVQPSTILKATSVSEEESKQNSKKTH